MKKILFMLLSLVFFGCSYQENPYSKGVRYFYNKNSNKCYLINVQKNNKTKGLHLAQVNCETIAEYMEQGY